MIISNLKYVTKPCKVCDREYIASNDNIFNPLGYMPGLCSACMSDILTEILTKGYHIFKRDYIERMFRE